MFNRIFWLRWIIEIEIACLSFKLEELAVLLECWNILLSQRVQYELKLEFDLFTRYDE